MEKETRYGIALNAYHQALALELPTAFARELRDEIISERVDDNLTGTINICYRWLKSEIHEYNMYSSDFTLDSQFSILINTLLREGIISENSQLIFEYRKLLLTTKIAAIINKF
jgi:hypothetical protein